MDICIQSTARWIAGRQEVFPLPEIIAFAREQFLFDKLNCRALNQLLFFGQFEVQGLSRSETFDTRLRLMAVRGRQRLHEKAPAG